MVQSVLALPEHLDVFENGIAARLDFSFSGPAGRAAGQAGVGRPHRDRRDPHLPRAVRPLLRRPHAQGGAGRGAGGRCARATSTPARTPRTRRPSSRRRPSRAASSIAQVNELVDGRRPRCRASTSRPTGSTSSCKAPRPNFIEPLFTRDPAQISEIQVLMAMMAIKGIYAEYGVQRLNHGIGFDTAAIELLLPTYGESLGLKGKICQPLGAEPAPGADPGDRGRLGRVGALLRLRAGHGGLHPRPLRRVLHRRRRQPAQQPRLLPGRRATTPATCSSARRCRSTSTATARPPRSAASPASAARPTWAPTRAAGATPARPG